MSISGSHRIPIFVHTLHKGAPSNINCNATQEWFKSGHIRDFWADVIILKLKDDQSNKKTLWFLPWSTLNTTFQKMLPYLGSLNDFAAVFMDVTYAQTFISTDPSKSSTTTARQQPVIFLNHWEHAKKSLVIMITKSLWPSYMVLNLMYFENLVLKKWRRKMVVCYCTLYINNKKNYPYLFPISICRT